MNTYKFYITIPTFATEVEVFPCNDKLQWKKARYKDECFFRKTLETALVFDKDNYWNEFWEAEKDRCRCNVWPIRIEEKCCNDELKEVFTGTLNFVDGNWDPENCQLTIKPRTLDAYSCMLRTWKTERNYLTLTTDQSISNIFGEIECTRVQYPLAIPLNTTNNIIAAGQQLYAQAFADANNGPHLFSIGDIELIELNGQWRMTYEKCQECSNVEPADTTGWTLTGGTWCRPADPFLNQSSGSQWYGNVTVTQDSDPGYVLFDYDNTDRIDLDNGVTFKDLIEFYLLDCFDCVISNFFNINPDGTAPDNYEYQCAELDYHNILAFQSSDVINPDAPDAFASTEEGAAGLLSWKKLWEGLKKLNLCMIFDEESGCLRIEHITYFKKDTQVFNLLHPTIVDCLRGKANYTIDTEDIPLFERLSYDVETPRIKYRNQDDEFGELYRQNIEFNGAFIEYDIECSDPDEDSNDTVIDECKIEDQLNDVGYFYKNERYFTDESALDNITLVSTDGSIINSGIGEIRGFITVNNPFTGTHIMAKYWRQDRPQCRGDVNGRGIVDFECIRKIRKMPTIELRLNCDLIEKIDPETVGVKTMFGIADIDEITYESPNGFIEIDLRV